VAARGGDGSGLPPSHASAGAAAAELFAPGVISDAKRQWRITFTADGRTAYFAESEGFFPATRQATIHVTRRVDGAWTEPEVAPFSGRYSDIDPFVTPDGSRLYFSSIRPVDGVLRGDVDIWYVERTPAGWGEARRLGAEVNGPTDELYASASADGDLYFAVGPAAPTPDDDWNIHRAARSGGGYAPRQPIAALNTDLPFDPRDPTADWEFNPEVSADGRALVFTSLRPGGHGQGDLYVSHHREGAWSAPRNLGPAVNTRFDEFHPTLARDGFLYFVRNSSTATHGDIYRIAAGAVDPLRPGARAGGRR
jgi:Tol biopolymer transport system component